MAPQMQMMTPLPQINHDLGLRKDCALIDMKPGGPQNPMQEQKMVTPQMMQMMQQTSGQNMYDQARGKMNL